MDKVKIRVQFEIPIDLHVEYRQFHDWKHSVSIGEFGKKWRIWRSQKAPLTNITVRLAGKDTLVVKFGYSAGRHFAWFEFNPSKFSDAAFVEFAGHLSLLLDYGALSLIDRGSFVYCELAIDVKDEQFNNFLFLDPFLRSASNEFEALGTMYVGSELGGRSFIFYDKAQEMLQKGKVDIGHELLRIEAKLKGSNSFKLSEAQAIKNPFSSLVVIDRELFNNCKMPSINKLRESISASDVSLQEAYGALTKPDKKAARNAMLEFMPQWWLPEAIWSQFPKAMGWLEQLSPAYLPAGAVQSLQSIAK